MGRVAFVGAFNLAIGCTHSAFFRSGALPPIRTNGIRRLGPSTRGFSVVSSASVSEAPKNSKKKPQSPYSDTVNLPQTGFEQRANASKKEIELQRFWERERIYEQLSKRNPGEKFVLHDGPPFANGPLHCGHALNKILKDFINRYMLMCGRRAVFVPGWDTHGLPIEMKVLQSIKSKDRRNLSTLDLRKKARDFASQTVKNHIEGMRRFGIWGDWENPYLTMNAEYEAAQIEVIGKMFEKGYVYRGRKPVHWSPSSRTALAEAELEYPEGHVSRSCYCSFKTTSIPSTASPELRKAFESSGGLEVCIWTTTPWTIPANRAVAVNVDIDYALVKGIHSEKPDAVILMANDLVSSIATKLGLEQPDIIEVFKGTELLGIEYAHPLEKDVSCRVVEGGDYITTETGTGLVHTAPGHGYEDYQTGLREGLQLSSPVDDAGKFTDEAANGRFTGLSVLKEGNQAVLDALTEAKSLLFEEKYTHKYPYDWRTKKPTIFRATEQWFVSIDEFRDQVLDEIDTVTWYPDTGVNRIRGMIEGRGDWCISRQRSWGVPIPVFYDDQTGEVVMNRDIVTHVKNIVAQRGTDVWWELEADELLPESYRGRNLRKGSDTLDVWFDSGSSWASVASLREELRYPADIYLEGSDQHRGWFQSSMLTSVAVNGKSPYKNVLTHGFVLDEKGAKMSKSLGNVVDPMSVIEGGSNKKLEPAYGADVLRLWVSSVDYSVDVMIGKEILRQVFDVYRKLRNTVRYMVGNIHDFDPMNDAVPYEKLPSLDKYILSKAAELFEEVQESYKSYSFFKVFQGLQRFAVVELSNFYLDIAKDRLYIPELSSFRRRSCQTVLAILLENYARALAPIVPHTAEDLWQNMPYKPVSNNQNFPEARSVFQSGWIACSSEWSSIDESIKDIWTVVRDVRDAVNKVLEAARVDKTIGASMEASVKIFAHREEDRKALKSLKSCANSVDELKRALIVSSVEVLNSPAEVSFCAHSNANTGREGDRFLIGMDKEKSPKCDRCWHLDETVGLSKDHPLLCDRCVDAVISMGIGSAPVQVVPATL